MPRIKVSFSDAQLAALKVVADDLGLPLAVMVANAAIDRYLLNNHKEIQEARVDLKPLMAKLEAIEAKLSNTSYQPPSPMAKRIKTPKVELVSQGSDIELEALLVRLGLTYPGGKATLIQLGGRDGSLFQGDLGRAKKVASYTASHDPEGLSWLPKDTWRQYWVQMSAEDYVRAILGLESK